MEKSIPTTIWMVIETFPWLGIMNYGKVDEFMINGDSYNYDMVKLIIIKFINSRFHEL